MIESRQVLIPYTSIDKWQAKLKKMLEFGSRLIYKVSNSHNSLGTNEKNYFLRNDILE
jgi:hypothetical protein